jgi:chromate reductase, NAD(P)H dehydrogenase (quinone)
MPARRVAVLVGSLRKDAYSLQVAEALRALAPPTLHFERVEIGSLPFYNHDLETDHPPPQWVEFRNAVRAADAILFVTPEYNRGVPAPLKNAVDVGSRPMGKSVWDGKPYGIVSSSPGPIGGFGANHQLRQNLSYFGMALLHQPEMYLSGVNKIVAPGGAVTDDKARELFTKYLAAFAGWIERCHIQAGR